MQTQVLRQITDRLKRALNPRAVYLFGSYARGDATRDSDIDLLIVMDSVEPKRRRQMAVRSLLRDIHVPKDILVRTQAEIDSLKDDKYAVETIAVATGKKIL